MIEQYMGYDFLLYLQHIREITSGALDPFFLTVSDFATSASVLMIMAVLYWCFDKKLGEYLLVSYVFARMVNTIIRITSCIYRPWIIDSKIKPIPDIMKKATNYSFPSGHATNATVTFGGMALRGKIAKWLKVLLIIWVLLICFTRNYIGVHTPVDVIAGFIITFIVLLIMGKLFDRLEDNPNLDLAIAGAGILFAVFLMIYATYKAYPIDYTSSGKLIVKPAKIILDTYMNEATSISILLCWVIERRFINFSCDMTIKTKIAIICGGLIGFQFVNIVLNPIVKSAIGNASGGIVIHILYAVYIMLIVPSIIKFFQDKFNEDEKID